MEMNLLKETIRNFENNSKFPADVEKDELRVFEQYQHDKFGG